MNPETILSPNDMEVPRLASELESWWRNKYNLFAETKEGRQYARYGKGLSKEFHDEIHPLWQFMKRVYPDSSGVRCRPQIGSQPYDAILLYPNGEEHKLEVTFAKDGYAERVQIEHAEARGHVNVTFPPQIEKAKGKPRKITLRRGEARGKVDQFQEFENQIQEKLQKKNKKEYESGMALVIGIDDSCLDEEDQSFFTELHSQLAHPFEEVYLVGIVGRIFAPVINKNN